VLMLVSAFAEDGHGPSVGRRVKAVMGFFVVALYFAGFFRRELRWRKSDQEKAHQKKKDSPQKKV